MPVAPSPSYRIVTGIKYDRGLCNLAAIATAIEAAGGSLVEVAPVEGDAINVIQQLTIDNASLEAMKAAEAAIRSIPNVEVLSLVDRTFELHEAARSTFAQSYHSRLATIFLWRTPRESRVYPWLVRKIPCSPSDTQCGRTW